MLFVYEFLTAIAAVTTVLLQLQFIEAVQGYQIVFNEIVQIIAEAKAISVGGGKLIAVLSDAGTVRLSIPINNSSFNIPHLQERSLLQLRITLPVLILSITFARYARSEVQQLVEINLRVVDINL